MPRKSSTKRRIKGRKRVTSGNNIRLKIKNLAKLKNKVKTRKYKRIQYGCKNMKGGNAMLDITGNIGGSLENAVTNTQNTLGGYSGNELFKGLGSYP
jgi:hypothetical protein